MRKVTPEIRIIFDTFVSLTVLPVHYRVCRIVATAQEMLDTHVPRTRHVIEVHDSVLRVCCVGFKAVLKLPVMCGA
jgi:hypothetical protein